MGQSGHRLMIPTMACLSCRNFPSNASALPADSLGDDSVWMLFFVHIFMVQGIFSRLSRRLVSSSMLFGVAGFGPGGDDHVPTQASRRAITYTNVYIAAPMTNPHIMTYIYVVLSGDAKCRGEHVWRPIKWAAWLPSRRLHWCWCLEGCWPCQCLGRPWLQPSRGPSTCATIR